jgi:hypothetical protein
MHLALRRGRGILTSMLIWSIPWAALGLSIALAVIAGAFGSMSITTDFPGGLVPGLTVAGAIVGAINGLVFALLLMLAERNHDLAQMRLTRVGLCGAIGSAATIQLIFSTPVWTGVAAVLGFAGGALALRLAARPASASLEAEHQEG